MNIHETIKTQMVSAMKAKEADKLTTLRGLLAAFSNEMMAKGETTPFASDDLALSVIKRSIKQRKDAIQQFTAGNRPELAEQEQKELSILEAYLPASLSKEEIMKVAVAKKAELNVTDKAKAGQLTGAVMKELKGKADGNDVKAVVDSLFV